MRKYRDRNQPLSTEDMWRIAENHDLAEKDYMPPKKVNKITERINHVQDSRGEPQDSSEDEAAKPHAQPSTAHMNRDEELHYTDIRSRHSQQQYQRRGYSNDRRGRRDNSTPATQVNKRSYNDLLIMLHPLLDRACLLYTSPSPRDT